MSGEGVGGVCELASRRAGGISERSGEIPEARRMANSHTERPLPRHAEELDIGGGRRNRQRSEQLAKDLYKRPEI